MPRVKRGPKRKNRRAKILKAAGSTVDRKILADLAVRDSAAFAALVDSARKAIDKTKTAAK